MKICESCFNDKEIVSVVRGFNKEGDCSVCGNHGRIYDTKKDDYLIPWFEDLVDIYTQKELLPISYKEEDLTTLSKELKYEWNIFNDSVTENNVKRIISNILNEKYSLNKMLFEGKIGIAEKCDEDVLSEISILKSNTRENFSYNLINQNRYHNKDLDLDKFVKYLSYIAKKYNIGKEFYRGRISGKEGINTEDMGAPESDKIQGGRVNAEGVRCLYLGDSLNTTIHEIRAGLYDYVTIGVFKSISELNVVDLREINNISPFIDTLDKLDYAINKTFLNKINEEMGKVMRKTDSKLEYIPTQYITDFVKSITDQDGSYQYDGIIYNSVMNKGGFNIAIFDPDKFECLYTKIFEIRNIEYDVVEIKGES